MQPSFFLRRWPIFKFFTYFFVSYQQNVCLRRCFDIEPIEAFRFFCLALDFCQNNSQHSCQIGEGTRVYDHHKFIVFCSDTSLFLEAKNLKYVSQEIVPKFGPFLIYHKVYWKPYEECYDDTAP